MRYTENEFCHITRGRVRIEDGAAQRWTFAAGDSFVIPAGFAGVWDVLEPTAQVVCNLRSRIDVVQTRLRVALIWGDNARRTPARDQRIDGQSRTSRGLA